MKHFCFIITSFILYILNLESAAQGNTNMTSNGGTDNAKITWYTFEQAVELDKKNPKKILIDVYTDWCGWCKRMDAVTFSHPVIVKYMNEHFYAVKLNAEQKEPVTFNGHTFMNSKPEVKRSVHELAASLLDNNLSYPTTVYLDEKFQRLNIQKGYLTPDFLEQLLHFFAENKYQSVPWDEFQKSFKSEIK